MTEFLVALGLVFVIEGLVFAAFPGRPSGRRRACWKPRTGRCASIGIGSAVIGLVLVWLVRG